MNQYIYLKGKLAGPVEMEEPTKPDPLAYSQMHRAEYSRDLYHYEENLKIYREYLESLPSIKVHDDLIPFLEEGKRYKDGQSFKVSFGTEYDYRGEPIDSFKMAIPISVSDPAPQPERLFTLQEMRDAFESGYIHAESRYGHTRKQRPDMKTYFKQTYNIDIQ